MNTIGILSILLCASLAACSPIPMEDADCAEGYWIIEAIMEGDLSRAVEIIGEHIDHLIATGKNIKDVWGILVDRLMERLEKADLDAAVRQKLRETLLKLKDKLQELQDRIKGSLNKGKVEAFAQQFSLIEDIKEVINQIKNQGGNIINTVDNIKDILEKILG